VLAHDGPVLVDAVVSKTVLPIPPAITTEMAKGFTLYMVKAVFNGRADDLVDSRPFEPVGLSEDRRLQWMSRLFLLSRIQFAFTITFHIIFPSFTIGLRRGSPFLEALRLATGRPVYRVLFDFLAQDIRRLRSEWVSYPAS